MEWKRVRTEGAEEIVVKQPEKLTGPSLWHLLKQSQKEEEDEMMETSNLPKSIDEDGI